MTTEQNIKTNLGGKKITELITSQECPKCGSEKIEDKDDKFSCKNCKLSFCCFGAEK